MVAAPGWRGAGDSRPRYARLWHRQRATFDATADTTRSRPRAFSRQIYAGLRHGDPRRHVRRRRSPAVDARSRRAARRLARRCRARLRAAAVGRLRRRPRRRRHLRAGGPRRRAAPAPDRRPRGRGCLASARSPPTSASDMDFPAPPPRRSRYDFAYGRSDVDCFPFEHWWRLLHRCARRTAVRGLDYGDAAGIDALREAIARAPAPLARRSPATPSQVSIVNGSQQALDLIARVLIERGDRVVIEDPLYQGTREVLRARGRARRSPSPVDRDGLDPAALPARARLAFVTPSHQFPTGAILSLARRQALLAVGRARRRADRRGRLRRRVPLRRPAASSRCRASTRAAASSTSARSRAPSSRRCASAT